MSDIPKFNRANTESSEAVPSFEVIVETYEAPISRYLYGMVGDLELARDLTQDTFLSAYKALPRTEITNLSGWLYRIATNHALSYFRRKKLLTWIPMGRLLDAGRDPSVQGHGDWVATSQSVQAALSELEPEARSCLLLKAAGFSSEEIGDQLNCTSGAARTRLSRARESFRAIYREQSQTGTEDR